MNLPEPLESLFHPKPTHKEFYVSLAFLRSHSAGCAWTIDSDGTLDVVASDSVAAKPDSWESRIEASDSLITHLVRETGTENLHQVVFGLPEDMLTDAGDIEPAVKPNLKKLSTMLDLTPVGFVNIDTAIVFQLKTDEGIPPSVILMYIAGDTMILSLYRVGVSLGSRTISVNEFVVEDVETAIKSFSNVEVLPSRMILYGEDKTVLDGIQAQLLTHQWPNRANFLHYPKIDCVPLADVSRDVALAGASELAKALGVDLNVETEEAEGAKKSEGIPEEGKEDLVEEIDEAFAKENSTVQPEDANIVAVPAESLGFRKNVDVSDEKEVVRQGVSKIRSIFSHISFPSVRLSGIALPILTVGIIAIMLFGLFYFFIPKATVTLSVIPHSARKEKTISIVTGVAAIDREKFIIPGKKQEKSVSGEKTLPVSGKKKIGDPAQGTVTLYNKTTTAKLLKKGTVISANALQFTLDGDIAVASASESIGSITFGKTDAAVTASAIGEEGNLPAATEFSVKGYEKSVLVARNDQPLSKGKSREVTVVSRADYDTLVKVLTEDLVSKAKTDLASSVTGGDILVAQTIKTAVTNKTFTEELDQEAKELHGKVTISVTGVSYNENDGKDLLLALAEADIPSGYAANSGRTTVTVDNPTVKKDGSMTVVATIKLVSLPQIDVAKVQKELAGKTIAKAKEILKQIQGVGSAEFFFKRSLGRNTLPIRSKNIAIDVVVSE